MAFVATAVAVTAAVSTIAEVSILTAMTYVGIGMTVVGAITGNQQMMKVGGLEALAGGIGQGVSDLATQAAAPVSDATIQQVAQNTGTSDANLLASGGGEQVGLGVNLPQGVGATGNATNLGATGNLTNSTVNAAIQNNPAPLSLTDQTVNAAIPPASATGQLDTGLLNASNATSNIATAALPAGNGVIDPTLLKQVSDKAAQGGNALTTWFQGLTPASQAAVVQGTLGLAQGAFAGYTAGQQQALNELKNSQSWQQYQTAMSNASKVPTIAFKPTGMIGG